MYMLEAGGRGKRKMNSLILPLQKYPSSGPVARQIHKYPASPRESSRAVGKYLN